MPEDTSFRDVPEPSIVDGRFSDGHKGPNPYTHYKIRSCVSRFHGRLQLPLAGPPETTAARIVRVHAGVAKKVVEWEARRFGAKPILPYPDTGDPNEVLLHDQVTPAAPVIQPGGQDFLFVVSGIYIFGYQAAPSNMDRASPTTPVTTAAVEEFVFWDYLFDRTLLRQAPSNGSIAIVVLSP